MTKVKVVTVQASMLPRPKQIEPSDLKFGSCIDELVPALRAEIKKANNQSEDIIKWQKKEIKRYEEKPLDEAFVYLLMYHTPAIYTASYTPSASTQLDTMATPLGGSMEPAVTAHTYLPKIPAPTTLCLMVMNSSIVGSFLARLSSTFLSLLFIAATDLLSSTKDFSSFARSSLSDFWFSNKVRNLSSSLASITSIGSDIVVFQYVVNMHLEYYLTLGM